MKETVQNVRVNKNRNSKGTQTAHTYVKAQRSPLNRLYTTIENTPLSRVLQCRIWSI